MALYDVDLVDTSTATIARLHAAGRNVARCFSAGSFEDWRPDAAHDRDLSVALKNDMGQAPTLVSYFDWTLDAQCFQFNECETLVAFTNAGKAVMTVECRGLLRKFCPSANALRFNTLRKAGNLKAGRKSCR